VPAVAVPVAATTIAAPAAAEILLNRRARRRTELSGMPEPPLLCLLMLTHYADLNSRSCVL
jgi:hypothetical protein